MFDVKSAKNLKQLKDILNENSVHVESAQNLPVFDFFEPPASVPYLSYDEDRQDLQRLYIIPAVFQ